MAWNPAQQFQISQRIPTRIVPSGTITLTAGSSQTFAGSNARQDRVQIVVTNLDGSQNLKVRSANNISALTVFPQTSITIETSADVVIYNPGSNSMDFEVLELYPDTGFVHAVPKIQGGLDPGSTPGVPGSALPGGGAVPAGGGGGGSSFPGGLHGGAPR